MALFTLRPAPLFCRPLLLLGLALALALLAPACLNSSSSTLRRQADTPGPSATTVEQTSTCQGPEVDDWQEGLELPVAQDKANLTIIKHTNYTIGYSTQWLQPVWVAYALEPHELAKNVKRQNSFTDDPIYQGREATEGDYKNSGYSRGHLAPSADMRFSQQAMEECFYFTNMAPQFIAFNAGIWNSLEQKVRAWAEKFGTIYIATGPCFIGEPLDHMGRQRIPVPTHFYKALLMQCDGQWRAIAFLIPHKTGKGKVKRFACSIDQLEEVTHIDFFPQLPDSIETPLEAALLLNPWFN